MAKHPTPNDDRSRSLNPQDPGGAKNLEHNAGQGTDGATKPVPATPAPAVKPANDPAKK